MTTTLSYALEEFVHEMSRLVDDQPDQETLFDRGTAHLERLINSPDAIPEEYSIPMPGKNHGTYLLHYGDNGLLVTSVVWGPGDHIGPHDHRTWGMIGVVGNGITETRFRRVDDRDREDHAVLERDRETLVQAGRHLPADPGRGRDSPDGQLHGPADGGDPCVWQRPARAGAQQLQPGDG